ncbi:hypothetical protein PENTCL1PPCAC_15256, partial [Pristionchus entomophagus]
IDMIYRILAVVFLVVLVAAQNFGDPSFGGNFIPCGFVCTRNAAFTTVMDGVNSRVSCSDFDGDDISDRCSSCCQSYALWGGLPSAAASGFPSSDGSDCVCCASNTNCAGGGGGPIATADTDSTDDN